MSLVTAWIALPLLLGLLSLGCGLLVAHVAADSVHGPLVVPTGFALLIVVSSLATMSSTTATLAAPLAVGCAIVGLGLTAPWRRYRPNVWAAVAAVAVFAVYAAPTVLSGQATFAGYITLDDTSTWLAITDQVMQHGRSLAGLQPSTYEAALSSYIAQSGYPAGSFLPLGIGGKLLGQDIAWLFQPTIAFTAAMLALGVYGLLDDIVASARLRALATFLAAQPALLYGYGVWSGIKEITSAALIPLFAAQLAVVAKLPRDTRRRHAIAMVLPLSVTIAAELDAVSAGGLAWLAPALAAAAVFAIRVDVHAFAVRTTSLVASSAILSIPAIVIASTLYHEETSSSSLTSASEIGNLFHPLSDLQVLGIWPAGDFRVQPAGRNLDTAYVLMAVLCAAAAFGLWWAYRRRAWALLLYVGTLLAGCLLLIPNGSPWVDGKALATASPAILLAGLAGAGAIFERGRRVEAAVLVLAIGGGVMWSNVLAYHGVWLAPRAQLAELATIGGRFAGDGPTLMTEYQPYGARHFLRRMDPEATAELRTRVDPLLGGQPLAKGEYADLDRFQLGGIEAYRSLVLRRSPTESRPPSNYQQVWTGRYYEVWQQVGPASGIVKQLPLGTASQPGGVAQCRTVMQMAKGATALLAVSRSPVIYVDLAAALHPPAWTASGVGGVLPTGGGTVETNITVPTAGRYSLWLAGSFRDAIDLSVDGRRSADRRDMLNNTGQYTPFGRLSLSAGSHQLLLDYSGPDLRPGSGGPQFAFGPVALTRESDDGPVLTVPPAKARTLCGKTLDWIESVSRS
jgi:hypothetical protein